MLLATLSCSKDNDEPEVPIEIPEEVPEFEDPQLKSLTFLSYDNPMQLTDDVKGEIIGDSIVDCWIPNITSDKLLVPQAEYIGETIKFDEVPASIGSSAHDFKKPVKMTIVNGDKQKDYTIYVHAFTGLPVMWIETEGRKDITSKEVYQRASFKLVEDVRTRAAGDVIEDSVSIKGRGNSTWGMAKKPYTLKFGKKVSLLGEPKDKSWVLLANYADKTLIRNKLAFYLGHISKIDYTPRSHFIELILNGRYNGTYQLCEKIKIAEHRVDVGEDGYILEIDQRADGVYFVSNHLDEIPVVIKDPDVEYGDDSYNYIKDFFIKAEDALYADNFKDKEEGWQKYIDIDSFVEYYIIKEIAKDVDGNLRLSTYLNHKKGGKLKMGPLWDFDITFGNADYGNCSTSDGFQIKNDRWFVRLFEDPAFVAKVKERFNYFYSKRDDIMREINANANYLKYAVQENENRWHTFYTYTWPNYDIWGSYNNEVQSMKEWLNARFEWLKSEFDKM